MNNTIGKVLYTLFGLYAFFAIGLLVWVVVYSGSGDGDTLEHVHASWLVYSGKIPYKDFFQHHNPLLWYIGAPFVGMFEYSLRAVDAVNLLTVLCTALSMLYIYKIHKNFLSTGLGGLIAIAFFAFPHESLYNKDFKPDNYMVLCIVAGIYYLLWYLKNKKISDLSLSFILLFASFMFTQKSVLELLGIGCIILYFIYKKDISFKDCVQCAILPIMLYMVFLAYLYSHDILGLYFKANFELNSHIPDVFFSRTLIHPPYEMMLPVFLSLYGVYGYLYDANKYVKVVGCIFIAEYVIRQYYFSPFVYYFAFLHAVSSIYAGYVVSEITKKYKHFIWIFVAYFMFVGGSYINIYRHRITVGDDYKYGASGFVLRLTNPCDYILNGYRIGYNLFGKDVDFIWNLLGQIDVIAATIGIRPTADLETLIRKYRPKIIYGKNYYDTYREYRGFIGVYPIHWISSHLLNEMYTPLHRDDLYILKPEYQSYDCKYNPRTKTYEYRDKF
jgi:hypothetical protein